jgi:hypothetical protein
VLQGVPFIEMSQCLQRVVRLVVILLRAMRIAPSELATLRLIQLDHMNLQRLNSIDVIS